LSLLPLVWAIIAHPKRAELGYPRMMWKTKRYAYASALPAIAAALALSSTPAWSQEAQPTVGPAPVPIDAPPPVMDTAPATADTTDVADPTPAVDTTATAPAPKPKARPAVKSTKTASTKPATTTHVASAPPAAPTVATVPPAPSETSPPIVDTVPIETAEATPAPEAKPLNVDEDALMLGGGALALLALGGGAFAMARRRRDEDEFVEETTTDETMAAEAAEPMQVVHDEQPPIVAPSPSAFAWGTSQPAESQVEQDGGETWVERAYRGPTEDNPSLSLRKRLKRAAFFDAREKRVAAGKADPVDTDAGLPESVASDTAHDRELELA
jgi:hypothetical protein